MLKRILVILFAVIISLHGFSQKKKPMYNSTYDMYLLHFGFALGINVLDFTIHNSEKIFTSDSVFGIENQRHPGFQINIVSNLKLHEYFDLRFTPGLLFGQRNLVYDRLNRFGVREEHEMQIESTFLEFPLLLKYKSKRVNNYRPYLVTGVNHCYDLEAKKKPKDHEKPKIKLKSGDTYFDVGFGVDFYFPWFKLSSELRYSIGLTRNIAEKFDNDNSGYVDYIDRMNSRIVSFTFYFE